MSIHQKTTNNAKIVGYLPAVLKQNISGWLIEYYCENPQTKLLTRKQIKLSRIVSRYGSKRDAKQHINQMIDTLNTKLADGWSPFFEGEDSRLYEKLLVVCEKFIAEREKTLRKNTLRSYKSVTNQIIEWSNKNYPNIYFSMFSKNVVVRFLDYIFEKNSVGTRTYNNIIKVARSLWNWSVEKCYTKENPFNNVKLKPRTQKKRILVPPETRQIITELQL